MIQKITCAQNRPTKADTSFGMTHIGHNFLSVEDELALLIKYSKRVLNGEILATKTNTEEKIYETLTKEEIKMKTPGYFAVNKITIKQPEAEDIVIIRRRDDMPQVTKEYDRLAALLYNTTVEKFWPTPAVKKRTFLEKVFGKNH